MQHSDPNSSDDNMEMEETISMGDLADQDDSVMPAELGYKQLYWESIPAKIYVWWSAEFAPLVEKLDGKIIDKFIENWQEPEEEIKYEEKEPEEDHFDGSTIKDKPIPEIEALLEREQRAIMREFQDFRMNKCFSDLDLNNHIHQVGKINGGI